MNYETYTDSKGKHAYFTTQRTEHVSDGVSLSMTIDVIDGEELDTTIDVKGKFVIAGCKQKAFTSELSDLINRYRI
ncbi:MAG: hypothetical protein A4E69_00270 [Syntrophus sp. PtaB.Bin138]|nr:MAG: hypothetical protein A4E69_00270 [Syntrophus sp. PtaB.Bin138]